MRTRILAGFDPAAIMAGFNILVISGSQAVNDATITLNGFFNKGEAPPILSEG